MAADGGKRTGRPRGRPRSDGPHPPLTRETIADAALRIAAEQGFSALTMRTLAEALNVTVRALYRHVTDRQEVIDLVADRIIELQAEHSFDVEDWRSGVRSLYRETRRVYRLIGRAVLFAFEETVTPAELPPGRILLPEQLLTSLTALGLSLEEALVWRQQFLTDVFGFALLVDYAHDRAPDAPRRAVPHPVQESWLDAHPDAQAPLSRQALRLPPLSADELYERMVDRAIRAIEILGEDRDDRRTGA